MARLPSTMTVNEVCMQAWIIGMSDGWCQGSFKRGTSRCLVGLLNRAMDRQANTELPDELAQVIHEKLMSSSNSYVELAHRERSACAAGYPGMHTVPEWRPGNAILITWNDRHATQEDVLAMLWNIGMSSMTIPAIINDNEVGDVEEDDVDAPAKVLTPPKPAPAMA